MFFKSIELLQTTTIKQKNLSQYIGLWDVFALQNLKSDNYFIDCTNISP